MYAQVFHTCVQVVRALCSCCKDQAVILCFQKLLVEGARGRNYSAAVQVVPRSLWAKTSAVKLLVQRLSLPRGSTCCPCALNARMVHCDAHAVCTWMWETTLCSECPCTLSAILYYHLAVLCVCVCLYTETYSWKLYVSVYMCTYKHTYSFYPKVQDLNV